MHNPVWQRRAARRAAGRGERDADSGPGARPARGKIPDFAGGLRQPENISAT